MTNGTGTIGHSAVTNVAIACSTNSYELGGLVAGLQGSGLLLQNSDGATVTVTADGAFKFVQPVQSGSAYGVTVAKQPSGPGQDCTVTNASGTVTDAAVSNIAINCVVTHFSALVVDLAAADEVWDPNTKRLYASLEPSASQAASIAAINPATGEAESSVATDSVARPLALSDDGQYLYAGLGSSGEIQRFKLPGLVPDIRFAVGLSQSSGPFQAADIAVQPGHPGTIAVSRLLMNSGARSGIAIFDDATLRPSTSGDTGSPGFLGSSGALWSADGSRIFSVEGDAALRAVSTCTYTSRVSANGIDTTVCVEYAGVAVPFGAVYGGADGCGANCNLQAYQDRMYSASGAVYDPQANVVVGAYRTAGQSIAIDGARNKIHFAAAQPAGSLTFETFNLSRVTPIEKNRVAGDVGQVRKLVRWGPYGLAAITDAKKLVLTSGSFVADTADTAISVDTVSLQDGVFTAGQYQYRTLKIQANQLAWNARQHVLYATVAGSEVKYGNSVIAIDVNSGAVVSAVAVGSEPAGLSLSDDSAKLWVGHDDRSTAARIATDTLLQDLEIPLFDDSGSTTRSPAFVAELAVQPGANSTVAIAPQSAGAFSARTVIVDNGAIRPQAFPLPLATLAWGSPTLLYASGESVGIEHFYSLQVAANGISLLVDNPPHLAGTGFASQGGLQYAGGLLYDNLGTACNAVAMTLVGNINSSHVNRDPRFIVDSVRDRAYMTGTTLASNAAVLDIYQLSSLTLIDSTEFPATLGAPKSIASLGNQGVAIATADGHVLLVTGGQL